MKDTLHAGLTHTFSYTVPENKTVPFTFPESSIIASMPKVFATGYMIVLMEWTCAQLIEPYFDEGEGSVGTHVDVSHAAATPPGLNVTVDAELAEVRGRKLIFKVRAHDGMDLIGEGRHERVVVKWDSFNARVADKVKAASEKAARELVH